MQTIITCNENSKYYLVEEFIVQNIPGTWTWLSDTDALFDTPLSCQELHHEIMSRPLVFVRNHFKVLGSQSLSELSVDTLPTLDRSKRIAIHIKSPQSVREHANAFRKKLLDSLNEAGYVIDIKNPECILQLYFTDDVMYYGLSEREHMLSNWAFGNVHYSKARMTISRAEFKLLEAIESFNLPIHTNGLAVDLGAAPGGWSYILSEHGYRVHAVDPAKLDPKLSDIGLITHFPKTSQLYLREWSQPFCNVVVNDMKMATQKSIDIFRDFAKYLHKDGFGIITLKLSKNFRYEEIPTSLDQLKKTYTVTHARQLFHNRHEITVAVTKK